MSQADSPVPGSGRSRALMPDWLRLVALFGIVAVNVQFIAFSALEPFAAPTVRGPGDAVALWLVHGLALSKSYGLFSFMFGVGLGFMVEAAKRHGLAFGPVYRNRMIGLAVLGVAHGCLFFPGDILVVYAVTGSVLYFWRDWPVRRLVRVGAVLLTVQVPVALVLYLPGEPVPEDILALERAFLGQGSFAEAVMFRSIGFALVMPFTLATQGIAALGWFCLGLAAVRSGLIDRPDHALWRRARRLCLAPGLVTSLAGAALWQWGPALPGAALTLAVAPVATLGYLGGIAALARPPGPVMARVLAAGGASLSVYLGQSILLSSVFAAYGLGLWEDLGRFAALGVAFGLTLALIAALAVWLRRAPLGPFEWVLRRITYAGAARWGQRS